jgi:integrase
VPDPLSTLFAVRRADIESFARDLEARGRAGATVTRRLCTIAGFYRYAVEEELLDHSPAAHVRRPRVDYESDAVALDPNKLSALLVAAGLGTPGEHTLISLLALNGLRVSEATGADIEHLGLERGHRTLTITRKGGKVVTIPLAPRTARAVDLAIGERTDGPVFLAGRLPRRRAQPRQATAGSVEDPWFPKAGRMLAAGWPGSRPHCSAGCSATTRVTGFVIEASHTIVPGRAGWPPPRLKRPAARSRSTRSRSPAAAITPGAVASATA